MNFVKIRDKLLPVPIIQGGMGVGVSLGNLAGNVAACGGLGVISAAHPGFREPDFYTNNLEANLRALKAEIAKAKEIASGRGLIGVNIMAALGAYAELVRASVEAGADAIISGAGLPLDLPKQALSAARNALKGAATALAPIVSSAKAAKIICRTWEKHSGAYPDFVVIEGCEAGGHLGFGREELLNHTAQTLEDILPEVLDVLKEYEQKKGSRIPVFVGGGVYTHEDILKFIALGASGVQIATRFIATHECDAAPEYKQVFLKAKKEDILIVKSPVGMPGRAIRSPLIDRLEKGDKIPVTKCVNCLKPCNPAETPYCITKALIAAVKGDIENGLFFCGSNACRLDRLLPVKELMQNLIGE